MKRLLLAGATLLGLATQAQAGLITVTVLDDGVGVALPCTGGLNSPISCIGGSTHFSLINIGAAGVPPLSGASLASLTIDATASTGGTHVLDVSIDQTGLNFAGGTTGVSTFTVNHLVGGGFGPTTMSTSVNGGLLASTTFPATATNDTRKFTDPLPALVTSSSHDYAITFTAAGQVATDSIQLVTNVPEPLSLALLGTGLLGLGLVRNRRRAV